MCIVFWNIASDILVKILKVKGMHQSMTYQGFPNWVDLWRGREQLLQNPQKLHENQKINILGANQWERGHGSTSRFFC